MLCLIHINDVLFLLRILKQDKDISPCSCPDCLARQGPCPGQVISYNNRTKNPIPILAIPGSFMKFPGSLHHLGVCVILCLRVSPLGVIFFW